jgi:hypothetical protein
MAAGQSGRRFFEGRALPSRSWDLSRSRRHGGGIGRLGAAPATPAPEPPRRLCQSAALPSAQVTAIFNQPLESLANLHSNIETGHTGAISETSGETSQELSRFIESLATAWRDGETRPILRKRNTGPRLWRPCADFFEIAWAAYCKPPLWTNWKEDWAKWSPWWQVDNALGRAGVQIAD